MKKNTCRYHYQNLDDMIYSSWDTEQNILKLVILGHFLPFNPPLKKKQKSKFWKMKKETPGDIIILHMCTINDNHMMHGSWDVKHDGQEFFVILDRFLLFYPLTTQKIKILKNWKKSLEILSFHTCVSTI